MRLTIPTCLALIWLTTPAVAAPTPQQLCESAMRLASGKYSRCMMTAAAKYSKTADAEKVNAATIKCAANLDTAFTKATDKYGAACAATNTSSDFAAFLTQCLEDAALGASGYPLPDYVGDLSTCTADLASVQNDLLAASANLTTCEGDLAASVGDLSTCTADLATVQSALLTVGANLTTCEGDLAACAACGNGTVDAGEACDGSDLHFATCANEGFAGGTLRCAPDCTLDTGGCWASRWVDNGDGTATDRQTGLQWELKTDDGTVHDKDNTYLWTGTHLGTAPDGLVFTSFLSALNGGVTGVGNCTESGGGFAGHCDWRLPTLAELFSIVDASAPGCGVGAPCTTIPGLTLYGGYWSSTTSASDSRNAWGVGFKFADQATVGKFSAYFAARAVRSRP